MHICVVSTMWVVILCYFLWFHTAATNDINSTKHCLRLCTLFCTNCVIYFTNVVVIILLNVVHVSMKLSISLISLWARPTTTSCQTQSGFGSWGGWPLSPATNLVANTIFTSVGLKWSRHANKVSCTNWAGHSWPGLVGPAGLVRAGVANTPLLSRKEQMLYNREQTSQRTEPLRNQPSRFIALRPTHPRPEHYCKTAIKEINPI
jgi:hypothetical protein